MRDVKASGRHALLGAALLAGAAAAGAAQWNGEVSAIAAQRLDGGRPTELGTELRLKATDEAGAADAPWQLRFEGRLRTNDRACSRDPGPAGCDTRGHEADLRELYAERQFGDWRAALGWQQVVWGRADNLRVLDLINPVDLRDFVLPDLNDYRRALPMLRVGGQIGELSLDIVALPRFTPNRMPGRGSEFYFGQAEAFAAQGVTLLGDRRPGSGLRHGELGVQLSRLGHGLDWSLMALSTYNDDPVYRLSVADVGGAPAAVAVPEYRRYSVLGGGMAASLDGGWVLRSEATWSPNTPYTALAADQGVERSRTVNALVGIDYQWRDWMFTAQANDRWVHDWRNDYLAPERATTVTLSATGTSLGAKLSTRAAVTWMPQNGDGTLWQLKLTYRPDDQWAVEGNLDVLTGREGGFFGQFRDRDRVRVALRRQF